MATLGDLVVNLTANSSQFNRNMSTAQKTVRKFTRVAMAAGSALAGLFATRASMQAAAEQIAAERKLAAVISATGGAAGLSAAEIREYAAELQRVTNFGDEATISAAAVLATFKNIKGDQFKEALAIAQDMSTVFGQDLQSSIVQVGKALDDPIRGASALRRIGVSLTEAETERIRLLQEQGDILGAQQVLMEALETQVGGAARAMADPITQAKNAMGDVAEAVGIAAIELATAALGASNFQDAAERLIGFINVMTLGMKRFGVLVTDIFKNIGAIAGTIFANLSHDIEIVAGLVKRALSGEGIPIAELQNARKRLTANLLDGFEFNFTDLSKVKLDATKGADAAAGIPALAGAGDAVPGSPATTMVEAIKKQTEAVQAFSGFVDAGGLGLAGDTAAESQKRETQFAGAATAGSSDAFSSIIRNVFGSGKSAQDQTAKNTAALVKKTEETNQLIKGSFFNMETVKEF